MKQGEKMDRVVDLLQQHFVLSETTPVHFLMLLMSREAAVELIANSLKEGFIRQYDINLRNLLQEPMYVLKHNSVKGNGA